MDIKLYVTIDWWMTNTVFHDLDHYDHRGVFDKEGNKIIINRDKSYVCACDPFTGQPCPSYEGIRGDGSICRYAKHITLKVYDRIVDKVINYNEYLCTGIMDELE